MSVISTEPAELRAIRPFTIETLEANVDDLLARIEATRWPVADAIYGVPRSWAEQAYPNLVYYKQRDRGGHFAAREQPQLLSEDVRATFQSLR